MKAKLAFYKGEGNLFYKFWSNHNHTIITVILVAGGCVFGYGIETLLAFGSFWFGREHSQAEYRYMKLKGINRSKLGFFDGFRLEAWNRDSFLNDLTIPIIVSIIFLIGCNQWLIVK